MMFLFSNSQCAAILARRYATKLCHIEIIIASEVIFYFYLLVIYFSIHFAKLSDDKKFILYLCAFKDMPCNVFMCTYMYYLLVNTFFYGVYMENMVSLTLLSEFIK